jgi:hypothetical protein
MSVLYDDDLFVQKIYFMEDTEEYQPPSNEQEMLLLRAQEYAARGNLREMLFHLEKLGGGFSEVTKLYKGETK